MDEVRDRVKKMAPQWAEWLAIDASGMVWAYEFKPVWLSTAHYLLPFWYDFGGGRTKALFCHSKRGGERCVMQIRE